MIRADLDPSTIGTVDPNANGAGLAGYWTSGPICTVLGPDAMNHIQEEIAKALEGNGITLDFSEKAQLAGLLDAMTGHFGDGSDGDIVLGAGTTTLTRDMHYENLTIGAGAELAANGHRIFVRNIFTFQDGGTVSHHGAPGGDYTGGPLGGLSGPGTFGAECGGAGSGGIGGITPGNVVPNFPIARVGLSGDPPGLQSTNGQGYAGAGGAGGNGSPGVNEVGADAGIIDPAFVLSPANIPAMITGQLFNIAGRNMISGAGGGGGGGAGSGAADPNGFGGGGGSGGGVLIISARILAGPSAPAGPATIDASGQDGGSDLTLGGSNGGGGGGGGGGVILLTTRVRIGDPGLLVLDVSPGAGGPATTGANGTGGTSGATFELFA